MGDRQEGSLCRQYLNDCADGLKCMPLPTTPLNGSTYGGCLDPNAPLDAYPPPPTRSSPPPLPVAEPPPPGDAGGPAGAPSPAVQLFSNFDVSVRTTIAGRPCRLPIVYG